MVRKIIWTPNARKSRLEIFSYWNTRNKSKLSSQKLNLEYKEALKQASKIPEIGIETNSINVRLILVSHFEIVYFITAIEIKVLDIWDTRQNPSHHPLK
jgi:plasmid stabilization system protein ParE